MLRTLTEQKLYIDIKMNNNFEPEKNIVVSGINSDGIVETHPINNVDFLAGIAKDKQNGDLYLLDRDAMMSYSAIYMENSQKGKVNNISEIETAEILAIDTKNKTLLYTERQGPDKNKLFVANYSDNLNELVDGYKEKYNYSPDYKGTITIFDDIKVYNYYSFHDKSISLNKENDNYIMNTKPNGSFVGNVVYAEYTESSMESNKDQKITLVVDDNGSRKLISTSDSSNFNIASRDMGPKEKINVERNGVETTRNEYAEEENERKVGMLQKNIEKSVINSGDLTNLAYNNVTIEDVKIVKNEIVGKMGKEEVSFSTTSLQKHDGQLYINDGNSKYQILSLDKEYVSEKNIKSIDDVFNTANELKNNLNAITIRDFDIVKESKYNASNKRFEEKYTLVHDNGEIPLDSTAFLSLKNGYLQTKNENYFLVDPKNPNLQSDITHASVACYIDGNEKIKLMRENNKVVVYDDPSYYADIIDSKNQLAFKDGVMYTIKGRTTQPIGADASKPSQEEINFVRTEICDIRAGKLAEMPLNIKQSEKVDDWSIDRYGSKVYLTGVMDGKQVNYLLTSLDEKDLGTTRRGLNVTSDAIPQANVKINKESVTLQLGLPSETMSKNSAYLEPMNKMIEQYGFDRISNDINAKMNDKLRYVEPQETLRAIPKECFVVLDDKLYLRVNNWLINNETALDFKNEQFNIQGAFTTIPSDTRDIKALMSQPIHVSKENGRYHLEIKDEFGGTSKELSVMPVSEFSNGKYAAREEDLVKPEPMMTR